MLNWIIRFPQRQQKLQGSHTSNQCEDWRMLGDRRAIKIKQGRGMGLQPMTKRSTTQRKAQRRLQRRRTRPKVRRPRSEPMSWPVSSNSQTRSSSFSSISAEGASKTIAPETSPAPLWCPPGLTHIQMRRIQWMRA
jgi:hypothetical protein